MIQLEALDDPEQPGHYLVQVCEYPAANRHARAYQIYELDDNAEWKQAHGSRSSAVVHAWHGELLIDDMETLDDPSELGYYVVWLQPYPGQTPKHKEFRVCIWRRGAWHDQYGYAKQYGHVLGWIGPFPMLKEMPWMRVHEREEAEDIGL